MSPKRTITSIFLVPPLKVPKDALVNNGFVNAYVKDDLQDNQYTVDVLYLLFKPTNIDKFREFLISEYTRTDDVIDDYDYEGGHVVVVYKISDSIKNDVALIKQGQYSKTSKEFQNMFPKSVEVNRGVSTKEEVSLQLRVFKKSPELRVYWENKIGQHIDDTQEVWEIYQEENEILNPKNIANV